MGIFRKAKKSVLSVGEAARRPELFQAVPMKSEAIKTRYTDDGLAQIRMKITESSKIKEFLARKLGLRRSVRLNLDERGTFFWDLIDGDLELAVIEKKLRKKFSLDGEQSKAAVIIFTKRLMLKNLIQLKVAAPNHTQTENSD